MSKREFQNALKYGPCDGSREFLATRCRGENAGVEEHECPLSAVPPLVPNKPCNCCDICTAACQWTTDIKKKASAERQRQMKEQLREVNEYLDNE